MKTKHLLSLIALAMLCATNAWGADAETSEYKWVESTKTLTIKAAGFPSGATTDFTNVADRAWKGVIGSAQHLIVEDGITHLGAYTFYNCSTAVDITLPAALQSIGHGTFFGCAAMSKVYFKGTPNQWASIDFRTNDSYRRSHPFYASSASDRNFYFYGSNSPMNAITLEPGITEVKAYAFYNATGVTGINIPGSVTTIRTNAFKVSSYGSSPWVAINKQTAPSTVETNAFYTSVALYIPATNSGYNVAPWTSFSSKNTQSINGNCGTPTATDVTWQLSADGVLTLTGHGNVNVGTSGGGLPYARFRRLVRKLVVNGDANGDIRDIDHAIHWCYGISEISINQNTIPVSELIATQNSTNYDYLFNPSKNVVLKIKAASLTDASVTNLEAEPWSNAKLDIELSDNVVFADNVDNSTLVSNLNSYVEKLFTLQLGRSMGTTTELFTFCSPINLSAAQVTAIFGASAELYTMTESSYDEGANELTLGFEAQTEIVAGTPYLIKPGQTVSNPTIENVNPGNVTTDAGYTEATNVTFYGTLAPRAVTDSEIAGGKMIILIGNSELTWANGGAVGGMRAYWLLDKTAPAGVKKAKPVMRIGKTATAIEEVRSENANAVRSEKVLRNGQIYILRDNKMYNMQGQLVK